MTSLVLQLLACRADPDPRDTGPGTTTATVEGFVLGPVLPCEAPAEGVAYDEVGAAWGLAGDPTGTDHYEGGGLAVDDLDGDGDLDVVITFRFQPPVLYRNEGTGFASSPLPGPADPFMPTLADVDGDGDRDLLVGSWTPVLLRNEGGTFTLDEAALPPLPHAGEHVVRELSPGDADGDGDVDLYAVVYELENSIWPEDPFSGSGERTRDQLLLNDGTGAYVLAEGALDPPEAAQGQGFDAFWWDWDEDGLLDVYLVNDFGSSFGGNVLWHNVGGRFEAATDACTCGTVMDGMGGDVGDYDGDGAPDLYLTGAFAEYLLDGQEGEPGPSFVDVTTSTGARVSIGNVDMSWGNTFVDHDNDGSQEILVAQGDLWGLTAPGQPDEAGAGVELGLRLLAWNGATFEERGPSLGLASEGSWRSVVDADFNGDGVPDLLATDVVARPHLYLSTSCTAANWLEIAAPSGSRVRVEAGGREVVGWVSRESGCGAARPETLTLGLGDARTVDRVEVLLPGGEERVLEGPLSPRRRVEVLPPKEAR